MDARPSGAFFPTSLQELFTVWKNNPDGVLFAGGTEHIRNQSKRIPVLPLNIISLDALEELHRISRTERYIEIGAMVKLNRIIQLGKIVPEALSRCLSSIAGPQLRNMATIGGNLCNLSRRLDATVPMIALDAIYELRTAQSSRWIAASRFSSLPGPPVLARQELLTRIRVPLEPWTYTWYRKFRSASNNEPGGNILIIIKNEKNILTNIRVVYSGLSILHEKNSETQLLGKRLPLERRDVTAFVDKWRAYLSVFEGNEEFIFPGEYENYHPELMKTQIINFIESTLTSLSD